MKRSKNGKKPVVDNNIWGSITFLGFFSNFSELIKNKNSKLKMTRAHGGACHGCADSTDRAAVSATRRSLHRAICSGE